MILEEFDAVRSMNSTAGGADTFDVGEVKILLVDDDALFLRELSHFLSDYGYVTECLTELARFGEVLTGYAPDLVLLDQRMGPVNGTALLKFMRERSTIPCIILTGHSDPLDRIVNLEIGADDEVQKSVAPREILARIRSVLRRTRQAPPPPAAVRPRLAREAWEFDKGRRTLTRPDGQPCPLTTAEYETLVLLHDNRQCPVSRDVISQHVFRRPWREGDRAVDTVIKKLRRKIEPNPEEPESIKTVRQLGYVFVDFPSGETGR